jgi:signal transduction histidine kinase
MATQTQLKSASVPASAPALARLWRSVTTPSPHLTGEERRRVRLLLSLLAVATPIAVIAALAELYIQFTTKIDSGLIFTIAFPTLLIIICLLARYRRYGAASVLFVTSPTIIVALTAIPANMTEMATYGLYYMVLSVLFANLLLNIEETRRIVIVNAVVIVILIILIPKWHSSGLVDEVVFNITVSALLIVSAAIRQQYLNQINQQVVELEQSREAESSARQQAERANQVKSAFLASMSHELRTPLNAIINFTMFVAKGDLGAVNPEQEEALNETIGSAKHLLNLINDVLDMSKIESGTLNLFVEDNVSLKSILDSVAATGKSLLAGKPVELRLRLDDDLPSIRADRQRIYQVLLNIVSNACKFTETGWIELRAQKSGAEVLLSVRDTGPGIAPEDQSLVFEAFKQTETGLRQGGGTGLGMPISRSLVQAHGGRLWLESKPGEGATFTVALPIKSEQLKPVFDALEMTK